MKFPLAGYMRTSWRKWRNQKIRGRPAKSIGYEKRVFKRGDRGELIARDGYFFAAVGIALTNLTHFLIPLAAACVFDQRRTTNAKINSPNNVSTY